MLTVARWLAPRPEIETVLHPALSSCPGYDNQRRDFTGYSRVFSIVFRGRVEREAIRELINRLEDFHVGYSWGGVTSLTVPYFDLQRTSNPYSGRLVRLHIGLEDLAGVHGRP